MKEYPSIPSWSKPHPHCFAFYKYDGSNLRFLWRRNKGWVRYGTRRRLFDRTDPEYGPAVAIFEQKYAKPLESVFKSYKEFRNCEEAIAFCEFFGPNSFAGPHEKDDSKDLMLFDVNIHKRGLVGPKMFLDAFSCVEKAAVVYEGELSEQFVSDVRLNKFNLREGVICKGGDGFKHSLWMAKIKTLSYLEELKKRYADWQNYWE